MTNIAHSTIDVLVDRIKEIVNDEETNENIDIVIEVIKEHGVTPTAFSAATSMFIVTVPRLLANRRDPLLEDALRKIDILIYALAIDF